MSPSSQRRYPSDLTDAQWELIAPCCPRQALWDVGKASRREIVNATRSRSKAPIPSARPAAATTWKKSMAASVMSPPTRWAAADHDDDRR